MRYFCARIYPCGEIKYSIRDLTGMRVWVKYNTIWRFGNTLLVNGKKTRKSPTHACHTQALKRIMRAMRTNNEPVSQMGNQYEVFCGKRESRFGYPDDKILYSPLNF